MTPDVGPPPTHANSANADMAMGCSLPSDVGTVDIAGCSQASDSPRMQVLALGA